MFLPADSSSPSPRSSQRKDETDMETLTEQNRQSPDTTSNVPSSPPGNSLFQSENCIQSAQSPTIALDEASRGTETFDGTGESAFDSQSRHPMPFNRGHYQPTEGASLPAPYSQLVSEGNPPSHLTARDPSHYQPTEGASLPAPYSQLVSEGNPLSHLTARDPSHYQPTEGASLPAPYSQLVSEGNPLSHLTTRDPSPIFADTVLSENVRKRFLFAKNQRQRPVPAASEESSGLSGQNRSAPNVHNRGDFVNYGTGPTPRLEDIGRFGVPVQDPSDGQFRNRNLSYNTPIGFTDR